MNYTLKKRGKEISFYVAKLAIYHNSKKKKFRYGIKRISNLCIDEAIDETPDVPEI